MLHPGQLCDSKSNGAAGHGCSVLIEVLLRARFDSACPEDGIRSRPLIDERLRCGWVMGMILPTGIVKAWLTVSRCKLRIVLIRETKRILSWDLDL